MYALNVWYTISDYAEWKKTFDADPLEREKSGVRRYRMTRPIDDEHTVVGALDFDSLDEAETFAARLRHMWKDLGEGLVTDAGLRISEVLEERVLRGEAERQAA